MTKFSPTHARIRKLFRSRRLRQKLSAILALALILTQGPITLLALERPGSAIARAAGTEAAKGAEPSKAAPQEGNAKSAAKQETQSDRDASVARIKVEPENPTALVNEKLPLWATAFDGKNVPVGGVLFSWRVSGGPEGQAEVSPDGVFKARAPGEYEVTVEGAYNVEAVKVKVLSESERSAGGKNKWGAPNAILEESRYGWNEQNYLAAKRPENQRGERPDHPPAVNGNFSFNVPILSMPGRGLDLALGLTYNSRLWTASGSDITYDIDKDWPAPGWSFSLPRMAVLGPKGAMLIEGDGTRHPFTGTTTHTDGQSDYRFKGNTTDGTFIQYTSTTNSAVAYYPDGTAIYFSGTSNSSGIGMMQANTIFDAHGNFISIRRDVTQGQGGRVTSIVDTLGRSVFFYYDTRGLLTGITSAGPKDEFGGVRMRTLVRFHYRKLRLSYSFSAMTPLVRNGEPYVIDAIYFPSTATGYWFGDFDSFSSFGMLRKVEQQRGMGFSSPTGDPDDSPDVEGEITPGTMTVRREYDYPLAATTTLTDPPVYSQVTESWEGMEGDPRVTRYDVHMNLTPRTVKITQPDNTYRIQYSENLSTLAEDNPLKFKDGLLIKEELHDADGTLLSESRVANWEQGYLSTPRATRLENYIYRPGRTPLMSATEVDYGATFNTPDVKREYDFSGALVRTTKTAYRHMEVLSGQSLVFYRINLVESQEVFDGPITGPRVFYAANVYDEEAPTATQPGAVQFSAHAGGDGDLTTTTTYANPVAGTGGLSKKYRYDVFGNVVSATDPAGIRIDYDFGLSTQYAYISSASVGASSGASTAKNRMSCVHDFNTGLVTSVTDLNGRVTRSYYDAASVRRTRVLAPTGAYTDFSYDDFALTTASSTYNSQGQLAGKSVTHLDGLGMTTMQETLTDGGQWSVSDMKYDRMNRVKEQSRPYFRGETPRRATNVYDGLGRMTSSTAPDGSVTAIAYDDSPTAARPLPTGANLVPGQTVRITDPWGKERWALLDFEGRIVEVVEPKGDGDGVIAGDGYLTKYRYDVLSRLVEVTQDVQHRKFKFDGLGRMTNSKLAEKAATLDDAGQYTATGGTWSSFVNYDTKGNLEYSIDARGVKTVFTYDDVLNRLKAVRYEIPTDPNKRDNNYPILPAAESRYDYVTSGDLSRVSQLVTDPVNAPELQSPGSTESYEYDTEGRLKKKSTTIANRTTQPMVVDYEYDDLGRLKKQTYPEQHGTNLSRKQVVPQYGFNGQETGLTVNNVSYASLAKYDASGMMTSLTVGPSGMSQETESFDYDEFTGLLTRQTVKRKGTTLLDLTYDYLRPGTSAGRTGQVTKVLNNLDHTKDRAYVYDALGRLQKVTGGASAWWQQYAYDRFGNRESVNKSGSLASAPGAGTPADGVLAEIASLSEAPTLDSFLKPRERRDTSDAPEFKPMSGAPVAAAAVAPEPEPAPAFIDYDAAYISHVYPVTNGGVGGTVTMRNTGSKSWLQAINNGDGNVYICSLPVSGNLGGWQAFGSTLPDFVLHPPNTNVTFKVGQNTPSRGGTYFAQFRLCRQHPDGIPIYFGQTTPLISFEVKPFLPSDAVVISQSVPATMNLGQTYTISVTLKNNGWHEWNPSNTWLGSLTTGFDSLMQDGARAALPRTVNPGETVRVDIPVSTPFEPGAYRTKWQMFTGEHGGSGTAFGDATAEATVQVIRPADGTLFTMQNVPTRMSAGQNYPVTVTMKNTGTNVWQQGSDYKLGSLDTPNNTTWGLNRVALPQATVASGLDVMFNFSVTAPSTPGRYSFQWGMVRDALGGQFFGEPSQRVLVDVAAGSATPTPTPTPGPTPTPTPKMNVALDFNGGVASSSSSMTNYAPSFIIDGNRIGINGGMFPTVNTSKMWLDNTAGAFPDWAEVDFSGVRRISEINVIGGQDYDFFLPPSQLYPPTTGMVFSLGGNTAFDVMYWDASSGWVLVPNGQVVGNNRVWRKFTFPEISTSKIRVYVNSALGPNSHLVELEAFEAVSPTPTPTPTPVPTPQPEQKPFNVTPAAVPGVIQAEDFDIGGEGVAYHDADASNNGGAYRASEGVDIEPTSDAGGGYNVGWMNADEWLEYTIKVPTTGLYKLEARIASQGLGRKLSFDFDGIPKTGEMRVPDTGGVQTWQTINAYVSLQAGTQVMRANITAGNGNLNFNYVRLTAVGPNAVPVNLAAGKLATQSSDYGLSYTASHAVDGNTNGNSVMGSVSSTNMASQSWWQVDLGSVQSVDNIQVWNRTDCCSERLSNFHVFVSDEPFASTDLATTLAQPGVSHIYLPGQSGLISTLTVNRAGRYVRVQLEDANYLSMAEVQVWGSGAAVATQLLADDFNDNTRDPLKWNIMTGEGSDSTVGVFETDQRLEITTDPNISTFDGYVSAVAVDLTGARATVEVPHVSTVGNQETLYELRDGENAGFGFKVLNGYLFMREYVYFETDMGGEYSPVETSVAYNSTQHRYWRLRHDQPTDTLRWETSADGSTWATQRSVARAFPINALTAKLYGGTWVIPFPPGTGPIGDTAFFDNFKVEINNPNVPPTVSLTAPATGSVFTAPAAVGITAAANDADGSISKVEFYSGATKLGEDATSPYNFSWTNVAPGSYSLTAVAVDNRGTATTSAPVSVTVTLPTVNVAATANASETGTLGSFNVTRSGDTSQALTVSLGYGGTATSGADYTALPASVTLTTGQSSQAVTVTPVNDALAEGKETIIVTVAADATHYALGANASATVELLDDENVAPSVTLTGPKNGASLTPPLASLDLTADASDADGSISKVEFYSGATKLGEDTTAPYGFTWANLSTGSYTLTAKAIDDRGASTTSAAAAITVTSVSALAEDFNDNSTDLSKWSIAPVTGGSVVEQNQRLEITPPPATAGYGSYYSKPNLDLTGGRATVEMVQTATVAYGIETYYTLSDPTTGNYVFFEVGGAGLVMQSKTNGVAASTIIPYDAAQHRYWRLRHDPAADTVNWDTSPDGLTWTTRRSAARTFPLTNLQVQFVAGKYSAAGSPGTAVFDNFRAARYSTLAEEFNDLAPSQALFVVAPGALSASDAAVKARLESLGFTVTVKDADTCATGDATGKALVVVSESVASASVNTKFRDVGVPVVSMEMQIFDDMQMTGPTLGTDYNSEGGHSQVIINNASHPLAAGLTGVVTVTTSPINFGWGRPAASATRIATMANDGTKFTVFGYESGATMMGMNAPARRVGLFPMAATPAVFNSNGWALFDAAVRWASNVGVLNTTRWQYLNNESANAVSLSNQQLRIALQPNTSGSVGIQTASDYDLNGRTLRAEAVQTVSQTGSVWMTLQARLDERNYFAISAGTGKLNLDATTAGVNSRTTVNFNPTQHRYWRLRHDSSSNTMNFETSANGQNWSTLKTAPVGFSLSALRIQLLASATDNLNNWPGAAVFDNVVVYTTEPNLPPVVNITSPTEGATFIAPATADITANASDPDGSIVKVEFFANGAKLGEDTTAPYSVTVSNAVAGSYALTAKASDNYGSAESGASGPLPALFVVGSTTLSTADAAVKARLESLGFTVTVKDGAASATGDATGKALVVISDSSSSVNTKFRDVGVPVLVMRGNIFDDMQMTGPTLGTDFNWENGHSQVVITDSSHPLAAGLVGTVTVMTAPRDLSWGKPTLSAARIATTANDPTKYAVFGYEAGASMVGMSAPARRVGLFMRATNPDWLTGSGWALFDAAARWSVNTTAPATTTSATVNVTVTQPTVTVTASDANAAEPGTNTGQFTITRTGPTGSALAVNYTAGGTATSGSDYTSVGTSVTIPAGASSANVLVTPTDDLTVETDETVTLTVGGGTGYAVGSPSSASVTISDNDINPPSISIINPVSGANFITPGPVNIDTLTPSTGNPISKVEFFAGTTKIGEDFTSPFSFSWTNVAAGDYALTAKATTESSAFTLLSVGNTGFESPSFGNGFQYAPANGVWTFNGGAGISGNSSPFTNGNPAAPEGTQVAFIQQGSGANFSQQVSGFQANTNYSVRFAAAQRGNCCGAGGEDFDVYLDTTLLGTFTPTSTGYTAMSTANFTTTAGAHTLKFVGRNSLGGDNTAFIDDVRVWGSPSQALFVVAPGALSASDAAVKSRLEGLGFTVTVKDADTCATNDATGKSIVVISESVASASVNTKFRDVGVPVVVMEMQLFDDMQMTGPTFNTDYGADTTSQVVINNASHPLAAGLTGTVTVSSSASFGWGKPAIGAARVGYLTFDSTKFAVFGYDNGTTMNGMSAPARRIGLFPMAATPSALNSNGWALFDAAIRWGANITATSVTATSAAVNISVKLPTVTVAATDASASETGPDAGSFTITRDGPTTAPLTVQFNAGGTATSGTDYTSIGTSVTIPTGASSAVVQVTPTDDAVVESGGETVTLTLAANAAYTVGAAASATVNIADDDTFPPAVTLIKPLANSTYTAPANITLEATASDTDGSVVKVEFFADGTKIGEDTTAPFTFDWANVASGTYALNAMATDNAGAATASSAVTVSVSLPTVTVAATDANASEAGSDVGVFTVTRTGDTTAPLGVAFQLTGTAAFGVDYAFISNTVKIPSGASSATVKVIPVDDSAYEGNETVVLTLVDSTTYTLATPNTATVTIADNDVPARVNVALASNGATVTASSTHTDAAFVASNAINGSHIGGFWNDGTPDTFPDTLDVTFAAAKTIDEIDVYTLQDNSGNVEPDEALAFSQYGLKDYDLKYWDATAGAWVNVPGASAANNNKVWRKFVFAPLTTTKIRLTVYNALATWSRVVELEAYQATNLALGKAATQSSTYPAPNIGAGNGVDGTTSTFTHTNLEAQAWWQVDLGSVQAISSIKLWNRLDCCQDRLSDFHIFVSNDPFTSNTIAGTQTQPGVADYYVPGAAGASFTQQVHRTGRYVRVQLTGSNYLSLAEVEVWRDGSGVASSCSAQQDVPLELFVRNFYQAALNRQPTTVELQQASDPLRVARAQGDAQLVAAAQAFGRSMVLDSPEYNARGRSNRDFVWDLYWAYLLRGPDQPGWDFWTKDVDKWGRAVKLPAFDTFEDFTNQVKRICPDLPYTNQTPVANAGGPYTGTFGVPIQFNGGGSSDPDGTLVAQQWNFGDELTTAGLSPQHTYALGGTYPVMLMVKDNRGALRSATATATVNGPQTTSNGATFVSQSVPATMNAGQTYSVSVTLRNSGTSTWTAGGNFMLGAVNPVDSTVWKVVQSSDGRVGLPQQQVLPGETVTFNFQVVAPSTPGQRNFQRRMLQHGVDWFGDNTTNVSVNVVGPVEVPLDGVATLTYDTTSNRITSTGYQYDAEGNMTRMPAPTAGTLQRMQYDAAGRMVKVTADDGTTPVVTNTYGDSSQRLSSVENGQRTYYMWDRGGVVSEFVESETAPAGLHWSKNYVYFGGELFATQSSDGGDAEVLEFHHSDRIGTRLVSNTTTNISFEQVSLPFGTAFTAESGGSDRYRYADYDRGFTSGLDYAVNRFYSPAQGRFTQVDPIGMDASRLDDPQSLNLYSYVGNDPANSRDGQGLTAFYWPSFFSFGIGIGWGGTSGFGIRTVVNGWTGSWWWFGGPPQPHAQQQPQTIQNPVSSAEVSSRVSSTGGAQTSTLTTHAYVTASLSTVASLSSSTAAQPHMSMVSYQLPLVTPLGVVIWKGTHGRRPIDSTFGHVSYFAAEGRGEVWTNVQSISWQQWRGPDGKETWYRRSLKEYLAERTEVSDGTVYFLDFGLRGNPQGNETFWYLLQHAYDNDPEYKFTRNNCGHAFRRAINAMHLPGVPENKCVRPICHQRFIEKYLRDYLVSSPEPIKRGGGGKELWWLKP